MVSVAQTTTFWETLSSASWLPNATTAKQKLHSSNHAHPPHSYTLSPPAQCWQALRCLYQPREIQSPVGLCLKWNQPQKGRRAERTGARTRVLLEHPLLPQVWRRNLFLNWRIMRGRWWQHEPNPSHPTPQRGSPRRPARGAAGRPGVAQYPTQMAPPPALRPDPPPLRHRPHLPHHIPVLVPPRLHHLAPLALRHPPHLLLMTVKVRERKGRRKVNTSF